MKTMLINIQIKIIKIKKYVRIEYIYYYKIFEFNLPKIVPNTNHAPGYILVKIYI